MRTARLLTVSRHILRTPPCQPCMPPGNHARPPATMHAPRQAHMPPDNHTCPPATMHTPQQPHMPPGNHACPSATMHAPLQPRMPPGNYTCPRQTCMTPASMHTPPPGNHACHPSNHAHAPATMHTPQQPRIPPWQPCIPPATMHAPQQPHMPPGNHACPPSNHTHPPGNHTLLPPQPCMPPWQPCTPPWQPCMPPWQPRMPPLWTEWQTGVKILPCPKLRLRAVITRKIFLKMYNRTVCKRIEEISSNWKKIFESSLQLVLLIKCGIIKKYILYNNSTSSLPAGRVTFPTAPFEPCMTVPFNSGTITTGCANFFLRLTS